MAFDLDHALRYLIAAEGSDLHLKIPSYPLVRLHGELEPIPGTERLYPEDTQAALHQMLDDPEKLEEFASENEVDFSYSVEGLGRFRVNAFLQRGSISIVMRAIPVIIKNVDELGLPEVVTRLAEEERGIILLTGTTGSGKSTTLAAMIDHMNRTMAKHIVTIEDPIEFLHRDRNSIINQREVGQDTASFKRALRRVLRQDPDVILVGEMRDEETVHTALSAAETGHLVLSTLHTVDAPETVNRIIDFFPPHQQQQARAMIAGTLKGIVSQRLVRTADGDGRVACCEILVMTGRVHDMILDPKLTGELPEVIAEGSYYGMQTFDQHLLSHLQAGRISMDDAMRVASSPHDFKLMVAASAGTAEDGPAPAAPPSAAPATPATVNGPLAPPVHDPGPPSPAVHDVVPAEQAPPAAPAPPAGGVRVWVLGTTTWSPSARPSVMAVCWSLLMPRVTTRDSTLPFAVSTSTAWSRPWRWIARLGTSSASDCCA
jgi:twitching motility protein PilT